MNRIVSAAILSLPLSVSLCFAQTKFYNYYDTGLEFVEKGDWQRAITEFKSAASLEFEDNNMKRTYGTRFIKYYPHREMGIAFYNLSEFDNARKELELSLAYVHSSRAEEYMDLVNRNVPPALAGETRKQTEEEADKRARELAEAEERKRQQEESEREARENEEAAKSPTIQSNTQNVLPVGALTYDPFKVTQVGSRLALAVLPYDGKDEARKFVDAATNTMITQLVNLRRFKVIERAVLDDVLKEQRLQASGVVDERTAVKVGRVAGADAIIMGSIAVIGPTAKVNARVIDTETSETIVARSETAERSDLENIERMVGNVAIMIYNELPLVEGYIISKDKNVLYVDVGNEKGVRKGSKCVAFREGENILHPKSGAVMGKKVTKLGELQVVEVQEKVAEVRVVDKEPGQDIEIGDKIVVK